jgi:hypothetical protein
MDRLTKTPTMYLLYSEDPRKSDMGLASEAAKPLTFSINCSLTPANSHPSSASSAVRDRIGVGATAPRAILASAITPLVSIPMEAATLT